LANLWTKVAKSLSSTDSTVFQGGGDPSQLDWPAKWGGNAAEEARRKSSGDKMGQSQSGTLQNWDKVEWRTILCQFLNKWDEIGQQAIFTFLDCAMWDNVKFQGG